VPRNQLGRAAGECGTGATVGTVTICMAAGCAGPRLTVGMVVTMGAAGASATVGVEVTVVTVPGVTATGSWETEIMATGTPCTGRIDGLGEIGTGIGSGGRADDPDEGGRAEEDAEEGGRADDADEDGRAEEEEGGAGVETVGMVLIGGNIGGMGGGGNCALMERVAVMDAPEP